MEVAGVQAQQDLSGHGVTQIELVRTDRVAFHAQAEEFGFHGIEMEGRVQELAENAV